MNPHWDQSSSSLHGGNEQHYTIVHVDIVSLKHTQNVHGGGGGRRDGRGAAMTFATQFEDTPHHSLSHKPSSARTVLLK